jgi:hypothetical protein
LIRQTGKFPKGRIMKTIGYLVFGLLACLPVKAFATGGLDCEIGDANLDFHYEALFSYSANSPLFQSKGEFAAKRPETYPALKKLDASSLHLIQQWYEDKDLRLQFYAETNGDKVPFASVKLTIQTVAAEDEVSYAGTYRLEIQPAVIDGQDSEIVRREGVVSCSAG